MASRDSVDPGQIESDKDAELKGLTEAEVWLKKVQRQMDDEKDWRDDADIAVKTYEADKDAGTVFNILHSNIETLVPALYNSTPVPDVRRYFGDGGDPVVKNVVDLTERCITYCLDQYPVDDILKDVVKDSAVTGRGVARLRYEPEVNAGQVGYQRLTVERVKWSDFIRGPALAWETMPWIAFRHDLVREELVKLNPKIGEELGVGKEAPEDRKRASDGKTDEKGTGILKTAEVYEIWDKDTRQIIWVAKDEKKEVLRTDPDALGLPGFFPVPKPLNPARRVSSMIPLCPFNIVRPLVDELDKLTVRINKLIGQLRVRGIYDGTMEAEFGRLQDADDGQYIGALNVAAFANGGLDKAVHHFPMDPIVLALRELYVQRQNLMAHIDQVAGISDILRGQVDPREKLGQSQIKQQWGSIRIQDWQAAVANMARELFRMKVAIFSKHFTPQNLSLMSGLPQTDEQKQIWPKVLQTFKSNMLSFRVDIETNSTIRADTTRNQEQMNLFLQGAGAFMTSATTLGQALPQAMPTMLEVFTAFARQFKLGKQAEDALDKLGQQIPQIAQAAANRPDPEQAKQDAQMKGEQEKAKLQSQLEEQKAQRDAQVEMQKMQAQLQAKQQEAQINAQIKMSEHQAEMEMAREKHEMEMMMLQAKLAAQSQELQMKERSAQIDLQSKQAANDQALEFEARRGTLREEQDRRKAEQQAANGAGAA